MLIVSRPYGQYLRRPETRAAVDWTHPAASALQAIWLFGQARTIGSGLYVEEISGLINPSYTTSLAGSGVINVNETLGAAYTATRQVGDATAGANKVILTTNQAVNASFSFSCYVMRSIDTDTANTHFAEHVQECATTLNASGTGWEFNLGNGFGAAGDKNKPRVSATNAATANAWLNGVKQSSPNPFDTALVSGTWYGVSGTISGPPTGDHNLYFFNDGTAGAGFTYGMSGGLAIFSLYNGVLPDAIMADLSLSPFAVLAFPDDHIEQTMNLLPAKEKSFPPFILRIA